MQRLRYKDACKVIETFLNKATSPEWSSIHSVARVLERNYTLLRTLKLNHTEALIQWTKTCCSQLNQAIYTAESNPNTADHVLEYAYQLVRTLRGVDLHPVTTLTKQYVKLGLPFAVAQPLAFDLIQLHHSYPTTLTLGKSAVDVVKPYINPQLTSENYRTVIDSVTATLKELYPCLNSVSPV